MKIGQITLLILPLSWAGYNTPPLRIRNQKLNTLAPTIDKHASVYYNDYQRVVFSIHKTAGAVLYKAGSVYALSRFLEFTVPVRPIADIRAPDSHFQARSCRGQRKA